jgi:hypothetical protein
MNFLWRNQYCIWFSDRCNYECSYCTNHAYPEAPQSVVESNPDALIDLFRRVDPGVIMLSGGEPFLWKSAPRVLDALPQHYWVFLTNLSFLPSWVDHPNIKLFIPAYHEEFADAERFTANLEELARRKRRIHVKIIVKPGREYEQVPLWERWNAIPGVVASLVPLEYTAQFSPGFLNDVKTRFRTCALYNSRFFRADSPPDVVCAAGTAQAFQVNADGRVVRCSTIFDGTGSDGSGSLFNPVFDEEPRRCTATVSCFCEWHHWAQMTPAHDNDTWTRYVETGIWERAGLEELERFVVSMRWDPTGRVSRAPSEPAVGADSPGGPRRRWLKVLPNSFR